jgi:hypothetical protein
MILQILRRWRRLRRYREISSQLIPIITADTQQRVGRATADAYLKATGQDSTPEDRLKFTAHVNQVNQVMSADNAARIRLYTYRILEQEERFIAFELRPNETKQAIAKENASPKENPVKADQREAQKTA